MERQTDKQTDNREGGQISPRHTSKIILNTYLVKKKNLNNTRGNCEKLTINYQTISLTSLFFLVLQFGGLLEQDVFEGGAGDVLDLPPVGLPHVRVVLDTDREQLQDVVGHLQYHVIVALLSPENQRDPCKNFQVQLLYHIK